MNVGVKNQVLKDKAKKKKKKKLTLQLPLMEVHVTG